MAGDPLLGTAYFSPIYLTTLYLSINRHSSKPAKLYDRGHVHDLMT